MFSSGVQRAEVSLPLPECLSTKWATYTGNAVQHNSDWVRHPKNHEFLEAFRTGREKFVVHRDALLGSEEPMEKRPVPATGSHASTVPSQREKS